MSSGTSATEYPNRRETKEKAQEQYHERLTDLIEDECQRGDQGKCKVEPGDFIIALAADPVHTHLALTFDRTMEVIQQALADEGYAYVRSIMPWDAKSHPESDQLFERLRALEYEDAREELPGLMVFRKDKHPLFVLVVGESPTRGITKEQFQNAIHLIEQATNVKPLTGWKPLPDGPGLRILGPTFSGSLPSLRQLLRCGRPPCYPRVSIHSGTVSGYRQIEDFIKFEQG